MNFSIFFYTVIVMILECLAYGAYDGLFRFQSSCFHSLFLCSFWIVSLGYSLGYVILFLFYFSQFYYMFPLFLAHQVC